MAKRFSFSENCSDNRLPRIGGGALIGGITEWPVAPDGKKLTLALSFPTRFLNENSGFRLPEGKFVSVFSYCNPDDYFVDLITYHGSPEELEWLRKGYTKTLIHDAGNELLCGGAIPMMKIELEP